MSNVNLTEQQRDLIERLGVKYEEWQTLPRAESRILALLLISDTHELTFDQVREMVGLSKSAASGALNTLLGMKRIEYLTRPGDRKRYFRIRFHLMEKVMDNRFSQFLSIGALLKEVSAQRSPQTPEFNRQLEEFLEFLEFMQAEIPALFERWNNRKNNK